MIFPGQSALANIKEYARVAREQAPAGVLGVANTVWCPYRHLQGAVVPGIALAGHLFEGGEEEGFAKKFAANYFGGNAQAVGQAIQTLSAIAPETSLVKTLAPTSRDEFEPLASEERERCIRMQEDATTAADALRKGRARVRRNLEHYDDILMSARIVAGLAANGKDIGALFDATEASRGAWKMRGNASVRRLFEPLAARTRSLYEGACERWKRTRYADDPKRDGRRLRYRYADSLVCRLGLAARFFATHSTG
jgi:hypothetical protein